MIIVDTSEVTALAADLAAAGVTIVAKARQVTRTAGEEMVAAMRRDAPILTGELQASIDLHTSTGDVIAGSSVRQGFFQEFGTSRHSPQPWAFNNGDRAGDRLTVGLETVADPL